MLQNNENELALMSQCQLENLKRTLYYDHLWYKIYQVATQLLKYLLSLAKL